MVICYESPNRRKHGNGNSQNIMLKLNNNNNSNNNNNNNNDNDNNNNTDDGMVMLRVICFGKYTKRWVFAKAEKWYSQKPKGILESVT